MSTSISDFARTLRDELDKLMESHISRLIEADASRHDQIAGVIKGLGVARKAATELAKKFQTYLDDEDSDDGREFARRQSSLPLSS